MATPPPAARARSSSRSPGRSVVEALPPVPRPPLPEEVTTSGTPVPQPPQPQRRGSFGFLKRGKSVERTNSRRSGSGANKLTKRAVRERELQLQREAAMLPKEPPQIPGLITSPPLQTFDGAIPPDPVAGAEEHARAPSAISQTTDGKSTPYGVPIPPIPGSHRGARADTNDRTFSITNRGRSSYASSTVSTINSPRRVRKRNDPTPFNVLVLGSRNSGKTAFINFLITSLAPKKRSGRDEPTAQRGTSKFSPGFISYCFETELDDGEQIALTIWDSEGIDKNLADLQLREISGFVESKFEETLNEELKVVRTPGIRDTHIHAVFHLLDPVRLDSNIASVQKEREKSSTSGVTNGRSYLNPPSPASPDIGSLDDTTDLAVIKLLQGKTTVIPVISKADTIPMHRVLELKRSVGESLKQAKLNPLESLNLGDEDDEEDDDDDTSSDYSDPADRPKRRNASQRGEDRDQRRFGEHDVDSDEDISNQSVLNLSSSSSGRSSSTSVANTRKGGKQESEAVLFLPHTVISPSPILAHLPGPNRVGRRFAWGFADPYNVEHCDFVKLRDAIFTEWRTELREASKERWYENWRTARLDRLGVAAPRRDLSGPPTTGRGARIGAQMFRDKADESSRGSARPAAAATRVGRPPAAAPRVNPSPAPGSRPGPSPAAVARPGQSPAGSRIGHTAEPARPSQSPAGVPRVGHSPAGVPRASHSPAAAPRMGHSPAGMPRMGHSPSRPGVEPALRPGQPMGLPTYPDSLQPPGAFPSSATPPSASRAPRMVPAGAGAPPPAPADPFDLPARSAPMTAEERRKQVPWPLQ